MEELYSVYEGDELVLQAYGLLGTEEGEAPIVWKCKGEKNDKI